MPTTPAASDCTFVRASTDLHLRLATPGGEATWIYDIQVPLPVRMRVAWQGRLSRHGHEPGVQRPVRDCVENMMYPCRNPLRRCPAHPNPRRSRPLPAR